MSSAGFSSPLRIAVDTTAIPPSPMGAGRYVVELIRALGNEDRVALSILTRRGDTTRWQNLVENPSSDVIAMSPNDRLLRLAYGELRLGRATSKLQPSPQVFFGPHYTLPYRLTMASVVTVHDLTLLEHPEWHERSKVVFFQKALRRAAKHATGIVFVSDATRDRFNEHFSTNAKTFVIPHGIDHLQRAAKGGDDGADDRIRQNLGITTPYVLTVGTIEPRKNHLTLIKAFSQIASTDHDLSLVIAGGKGWASTEVADAVAASPVRDRIKALGYVADDQLPALYRGAQVTSYASFEEGFGLPALEALSYGSPLVTTKGTTMAEFAGDVAVTVQDPRSVDQLQAAIVQASIPDAQRRARGMAVADTFTWKRCAEGHIDAFCNVVDR